MSKALLHLNYSGDTNFNDFLSSPPASGGVNVEMELITASPTCAASSCTYRDLLSNVEPSQIPEVRVFGATSGTLMAPQVLAIGGTGTVGGWNGNPYGELFWDSLAQGTLGFDNNRGSRRGPAGRAALFQLLTDLLEVGGAGATAKYTPPQSLTVDPRGDVTTDPQVARNRAMLRPTVEVGRAAATALERGTFTHLETTGLPERVLGIGQQVKEVNSYLRLGGSRDTNDPMNDVAVPVKVENYFGWMANSMFTVRRVTASRVAGRRYDFLNGGPVPDASDEIRVSIGMASGSPSGRPSERTAEGMTDPGTWTGSMIGVGSVRGERYRGRSEVSVNFDTNSVTTEFSDIRLARDSDSDLNTDYFDPVANREQLDRDDHVGNVHPELENGISFESAGIMRDGSFTSSRLMDGGIPGLGEDRNGSAPATVSSLSGQFYGPDAAEVAGTFTAYGLALGKTGEDDTPGYRGDLVGAFGAARDAMEEAEDN